MPIALSTLLARCEARLTDQIAGVRILDVAGPVQLQSRPQQRLHKTWRSTARRRMIWRTSMVQSHRECAIFSSCSSAIGYALKARALTAAALDVENEVIQALTDHAWALATTWSTPADQPLITFDSTSRSWPVAEWQLSEIAFSVHRNQAAD